jgi:hypothetical protein
MGSGLRVDLLEVVAHHRAEHAAPPVVGMDTDPGQAGARGRPEAAVRTRRHERERVDPVDARVRRRVRAVDIGCEPLAHRQAGEQRLGGRRGDLREPHGLVGGQETSGVRGAVDPDRGVAHPDSQPLSPPALKGMTELRDLYDGRMRRCRA